MVPPVPGVIAVMSSFDFQVRLSIVPRPKRIWELKVGERFCLSPTCYNSVAKRYEIYLKISKTKCVLDSIPHKEQHSIPLLLGSIKEVDGYPIIEEWQLPQKEVEEDG